LRTARQWSARVRAVHTASASHRLTCACDRRIGRSLDPRLSCRLPPPIATQRPLGFSRARLVSRIGGPILRARLCRFNDRVEIMENRDQTGPGNGHIGSCQGLAQSFSPNLLSQAKRNLDDGIKAASASFYGSPHDFFLAQTVPAENS
jgi:hypothetical protein